MDSTPDSGVRQTRTAWHSLSVQEVVATLDTDPEEGLRESEVETRLARFGRNEMPDPPTRHPLLRMLSQLADPLVGALLVAAAVAAVVAASGTEGGSWVDAGAILGIVVLNAVLGFLQERRAEQALAALRSMASPRAKVVRVGEVKDVDAKELVPGDLIVLHAGDSVPADLRLVTATGLAVEEAALTGESVPVEKRPDQQLSDDTALGDRQNLVFTGTTISAGHAQGLVVTTGVETELGKIGALLRDVETEPTPLEKRLDRLGKYILIVCLAISALVFGLGFLRGDSNIPTLLLVAVSLAVAAIPEGLPAITTITLALGMQRMAHRGAIIRKLPAVETLGSATVICTDKTGTLTQNAMTVRLVETAEYLVSVTGEGFQPEGHLELDGERMEEIPEPVLRTIIAGVVANESHLEVREEGRVAVVGNPTEGALLVLGKKAGTDRKSELTGRAVTTQRPFDGERKRMSVIVEEEGRKRIYVKGSPDVILPRCDRVLHESGVTALLEAERARLIERNEAHAGNALRVLALAEADDPEGDVEDGLVFLGLVAMIDPPRADVKDAIAECHSAGIRVVMITGDHRLTGVAIATELGIHEDGDRTLTGTELAALDENAFAEIVDEVTVYARVTAEQKLQIVRALTKQGHVVSMTGDGVNDAPALKEAAIGVAMGKTGTDVARQSAEMVLADDAFSTIVVAIREGRAIFRNIQNFIYFLGSSNAGLVFAVIAISLFDGLPQFSALQLLWINLVTNGLPALALGVDPPERSQMQVPPRSPTEGIVGLRDYVGVVWIGLLMGGAAMSFFAMVDYAPEWFNALSREGRMAEARTMSFALLSFSPLFHAHNCRSPIASIFSVGLFSNRFLWIAMAISAAVQVVAMVVPAFHHVFGVTALDASQWGLVLALSALPIPVVELQKAIERLIRKRA